MAERKIIMYIALEARSRNDLCGNWSEFVRACHVPLARAGSSSRQKYFGIATWVCGGSLLLRRRGNVVVVVIIVIVFAATLNLEIR